MVEAGDYDFVAGLQLAADGAGHRVGERGHVGAEGDFVGGAVQEVGHGGAGFGDHGVGAAAGGVGSAGVGVVAAQVVGDGVDDALRHLRPAGAVEERGGVSVDGLGEGGELGADVGEVEGGSDVSVVGMLILLHDRRDGRNQFAVFLRSRLPTGKPYDLAGRSIHRKTEKNVPA